MLSYFEILHDSSRSYNAVFQMFYAEAFERFSTKMFQQFLTGILFSKYPIIKFKNAILCSEVAFKVLSARLIEKNLFR